MTYLIESTLIEYPECIKKYLEITPDWLNLYDNKEYTKEKLSSQASYLGDYLFTALSDSNMVREIFMKNNQINTVNYYKDDFCFCRINFHCTNTVTINTFQTLNSNKKNHSYDDNPAIVQYEEDGKKYQEFWYNNGIIDRPDGKYAYIKYSYSTQKPVLAEVHLNGKCIRTDKFNSDGELIESITK